MRRLYAYAALALLGLAPTVGQAAERLVLQAEDTPGMTRIEILVGDIPFSLEKPETGVIDFVTPYRFQSVNLAKLIAGAGAKRVATARIVPDEAATRLRMVLNCACGFDFSVSSGALSVRIKDPIAVEAPSTDPETDEAPQQAVAAAQRKPAPAAAPAPRARPKAGASPSLVADAPVSATNPTIERSAKPQGAALTLDASEQSAKEVTLARDHLMRQLSRAAEQGLIQFVDDEAAAQSPPAEDILPKTSAETVPDSEPDEEAPTQQPAEEAPEVQDVAEATPAPPLTPVEIPVRARTAVDKVFAPDRSETRADIAYCIDQKRLDLPAWTQPGSFLTAKRELRAKLLDEFDQPRPDIATKLVRHLILNGFGVEADAMIDAYGDVIDDHEALSDLARLIDFKMLAPDGDIARSAPCHAEAAFWRLVANLPDGEPFMPPGGGPDETPSFTDQALDAFARLPAVTRRILSARLMNNLIDKGEIDLAEQLDRILRRSPSSDNEALTLARARLLGETGRLEEAEDLYARLAQSNRPEARQALILLLDSRARRNAGGSEDLSNALADAAFIARGTEAEVPLKVAEIRSRTLTDGASGALGALQAEIERSGGASGLLQDVGHAALEQLTTVNGDAIDYARAVMALRPYVSEGVSGDPARRQVADTLTAAGLPNLALTYLEPALKRENRATSLIAARMHLALGDAEAALAALEGRSDPEATPLRIDALERLGRYEEAHRLSSGFGQADTAAQSARALRAGEWADASAAGETEHRLLAAYMASQKTLDGAGNGPPSVSEFLTAPEVDKETTLESVRSVVEASRSARSIIERALEDG